MCKYLLNFISGITALCVVDAVIANVPAAPANPQTEITQLWAQLTPAQQQQMLTQLQPNASSVTTPNTTPAASIFSISSLAGLLNSGIINTNTLQQWINQGRGLWDNMTPQQQQNFVQQRYQQWNALSLQQQLQVRNTLLNLWSGLSSEQQIALQQQLQNFLASLTPQQQQQYTGLFQQAVNAMAPQPAAS